MCDSNNTQKMLSGIYTSALSYQITLTVMFINTHQGHTFPQNENRQTWNISGRSNLTMKKTIKYLTGVLQDQDSPIKHMWVKRNFGHN